MNLEQNQPSTSRLSNWLRAIHPRNSLVAQISYAMALVSIVLSVALSYYAANLSRHQIEQELGSHFLHRAKDIVDVLDRGMFERYREVQIVATLNDIRTPSVSIDQKRSVLEKLQQTFNAYAWVGICDTQGKGMVGTGKYLEGKDLSKRPWCTKGRDKPYVGDVHDALLLAKILPNPSGENFYLVDVAAPVVDKSGALQGVLCGHIYWKWAEELLDSKKDESFEILLLSRDGLVLTGPEQNRSELKKLAPNSWRRIIDSNRGQGTLLDQWNNGKQYLVGFAHDAGYRDYPGLGWIAVVRQDVSTAFAPARTLQLRILFAGVMLGIFFIFFGAWMARRIATPISRITAAAERIAAGEFEYDAPPADGDGEVAHLSASIHTMVNNLTREILDRKRAEEQLRLSAAVFANNSEAIVITDEHNNIVRVNDAFSRISGFSAEEAIGQNPRLFASGSMDKAFYQQMWTSLLENNGWTGEIWNKRKNGEIFPEWMILSLVRDEAGHITNHIAIYSDITERKHEEERFQFLANHDVLTGLPNRTLLTDRLEQALAFAERNKTRVAVLFIDLDHFKNINDSLGHDVGDELLRQAALRISACFRRTDTIARLGGDEFIAVLPEIGSENEVISLSEKMLHAFAEKFMVNEHQLSITPSIGISLFPDDALKPVTLMRNADIAMYRAKAQGRNTLQFYRPEMTTHATERLQMEMQLRHAIENDELFLHYQPQVDLNSGDMTGMECLIRWKHPEQGMISPARFIPIAEETGLILEIGAWVLREACTQGRIWQKQGYKVVPIAVNVSGVQFRGGKLAELVSETLHETGFDPHLLDLEITESVLMASGEASLDILNSLKALGLTLSLDDFGTGYSSLSRLKSLPLDYLKVDQSFVRDIATDPNDAAIVRAILSMSHEMNLKVIAEGVETTEQLEFLRGLKCLTFQGYLFSRPVPSEEIELYLKPN